ncbi:MAG: hypothetical protein Q9M17_02165 [Mariprofundus sp.]|nr:hypothetical protein [Mariprofundus sp.]
MALLMDWKMKYLFAFVCSVCFLIAGEAQAQNITREHDEVDDCADSSVAYEETSGLTREETIHLMDQALLNSLNKYERCQNRQLNAAVANDATNEEESGSERSTASSEMTGTSKSTDGELQDQAAGADPEALDQRKNVKAKKVLGSGKVPDDIPPADNDSVLEEQIRQAAINESDPVIKEKLWNEYRKYKGLPVTGSH